MRAEGGEPARRPFCGQQEEAPETKWGSALPPAPTVIRPCSPASLRPLPLGGLATGSSALSRVASHEGRAGCDRPDGHSPAGKGHPDELPGFARVASPACASGLRRAAPADVTFFPCPWPVAKAEACRATPLHFRPPDRGPSRRIPARRGKKGLDTRLHILIGMPCPVVRGLLHARPGTARRPDGRCSVDIRPDRRPAPCTSPMPGQPRSARA